MTKMNKYLSIAISVCFSFIFAQNLKAEKVSPGLMVNSRSASLECLNSNFNLIDFSRSFTCLYTDEEVEKRELNKKIFEELVSRNFFKGYSDCYCNKIFDAGSFCFWCFNGDLFLIEKTRPDHCIRLCDINCKYIQTVEMEKLANKNYRIFVTTINGVGHFGFDPSTRIFDLDLNRGSLTEYEVRGGDVSEFSCGSDLERKGQRDWIVYEYTKQPGEVIPALLLSWDGKKWVDVTLNKSDLLKRFKFKLVK